MKSIKVEVTGITPVLIDAFTKEREVTLENHKKIKSAGIKNSLSPEEQAEEGAYRLNGKKSNLYLPFSYFYGAMINASMGMKANGKALKSIIAGCVRVEPEKIDLKTNKYEIDSRTIVNRPAGNVRVLKHRPKIFPWKVNFNIIYNEDMLTPAAIKELLTQAGLRIGIGSYRPTKSGPFGTFTISKWEE